MTNRILEAASGFAERNFALDASKTIKGLTTEVVELDFGEFADRESSVAFEQATVSLAEMMRVTQPTQFLRIPCRKRRRCWPKGQPPLP